MAKLHILLFLFLGAFVISANAAGQTFCKCTCFKNSTIIPLDLDSKSFSSSPASSRSFLRSILSQAATPGHLTAKRNGPPASLSPRASSKSCSSCTKAFCLNQGIEFCEDAEEDDVMTLCFQRDSNKDKIIVWAFIIGTVGLMGWAGFKRVVEVRAGGTLGNGAGFATVR